MFQLFYAAQCLHFFRKSDSLYADDQEDTSGFEDQISRIVSTVLKIAFIMMEIPFLHYLNSVKSLNCKTRSQYLLLPIMGANFAMWFYTFLDETQIIHLYNYHYPTQAYVYNISVACQNHSSVTEIYMRNSMYKIFYPISMEFCIACFEILHLVYTAKVLQGSTPEVAEYSTQELDEIQCTIQSLTDDEEHPTYNISSPRRIWKK